MDLNHNHKQSKHNSNKQQYQGNWNEYETSKKNKTNKKEREKKQALFKIYLVLVRLTGNKEHILYIWVWFFCSHRKLTHSKHKV